ncbi:hypothetical protein SDC9_152312 [bioreactor metagenome]|uniref:Uncharacterized protein n=1 Tax=bioreactor metagenome TaxID=1076179 RepID=A0A645EV06_9ZZZZ
MPVGGGADFGHYVVDLALQRADLYLRVQQPGRANDLIDNLALRLFQLVVGRGGGNINGLTLELLKFEKLQRPIFKRRKQPEAMVAQGLLAVAVGSEHRAQLRDGGVRLVDYGQLVLGKEVDQAVGPSARIAAGKMHGIVFDAGAVANLLEHFQIIVHALVKPLRLHQQPLPLEPRHAVAHLGDNSL